MFSQTAIKNPNFHKMVGATEPMSRIYELIRTVAPTKAPVVIVGESGTGKELTARAIHDHSSRKDKPFVAVNCSATSPNLWESEMFGHEKGAFTGAVGTKKGRFECAHQGTLLLDEISEMPPSLQVKLLRVLQEMEFERVGGTRTIKADVRLIAATNRDLKKGVQQGWFREDLFFRLNVITMTVPPLRDRKEDIPPLVDHFLAKYARETEKDVHGISCEAMEALTKYAFPGNVRELENIIQRAVILAKGTEITLHDLPEDLSKGLSEENDGSSVVRTDDLFKALETATICNNGGPPKLWYQTLKSISLGTIFEFLLKMNTRQFSRNEFATFLSHQAKSDRNKYGTAGKYLSILKKNRICVHNSKKANQSRYRLSDVFLTYA